MNLIFLGDKNQVLVNLGEINYLSKGALGARWCLTITFKQGSPLHLYYPTEADLDIEWKRITSFVAHLPQK